MKKKYNSILPLDENAKVTDQFGWLPVSVIEPSKTTKKKWIDAYLNDGIKEQRRSDDAEYLPGLGFSEFHAGLAEDILLYWSMDGSIVVDPFAGRVTRAHVSAQMNRKYEGYEISPTTYDRTVEHLKKHKLPFTLYNRDGCIMANTPNDYADLVFTCPPYFNLEKYESCEYQLSDEKSYEDFLKKIYLTGKNIERVLKPGGFCVWVCGDWRDGKEYRVFHGDTIRLFKQSGLQVHDIIIMKNQSPFAALQMGKVASKRYTSKIHEYILVFRKKGDLEVNSTVINRNSVNDFWD